MAAAVQGWRRVRRWIARGLATLVIMTLLAVAVALVFVHTDRGRDFLRKQVVAAMQAKFRGPVTIGHLDGSVFTKLVVSDVQIDDANGAHAVKIDKLILAIDLLSLLDHQVHLPLIALDGVEVNAIASPAGLNLATMMVPSNAPMTSDIVIDKLAVTNANISYRDATGIDNHLDKLAITSGLVMRTSGAISGHAQVDGTWRERQQPLHVDGQFAMDGTKVDVDTALVKLGDASVALHGIHFTGVALAGTVDINAPHKLIGALLPNGPLLTDVTLSLTFTSKLFATMATIHGAAGKATLTGVLSFDPVATPPRVVGTLSVASFDAAAIARGTPVTDGDVSMLFDASIDPAKSGLAAIRGRVTAHARGSFDHIEIARADVAARVSGGHINAAVDAHAAGDARFAAIASADLEANSVFAVEHARVIAHVGDLGAAASGLLPNKGTDAHVLKGSLDARITGRGRLSTKNIELDLESHLDAEDVQYDTIGIGHLQADIQATGLPYRPTGHADIHIAGISNAGKQLGEITIGADSLPNHHLAVAVRTHPVNSPLQLDLDADVGLSQRELAVVLGHHRLLTRGVDWAGDGGTIVVNDQQVAVHDLRTTIGSGSVDLDASYQRSGRNAGDIAGHLRAHGLDFAEVATSLGLGPLAGHGELEVNVSGHGKTLHGELHGDVRGLVIKAKAAPLDIVANGQLAPGRIQFDGTVENKDLGAVKASIDVDAPVAITDLHAWARLPRAALRKADFIVEKLDLTALLRALGQPDLQPEPLKGTIDGKFSLTDKHVGGTMNLHALTAPRLPTQIDGDITLADGAPMPGNNPTIVVDAHVTAKDMAAATAHATLEMPQHLFDPKAWLALGAEAVRGATLDVDGAMLDAELTRRFGIVAPLSGHATLAVEVAPGLTSATATLHVDKFLGGPVIRPIDLEFKTVIDRNGVDSTLVASIEKLQLLDAKVHAALNLAALLADASDSSETLVTRLMATPMTGSAAIDRVEIDALSQALGRSQKLVGTILFNGSLTGTVGKPDATFKATLTDFGNRQPQLHELTVDGHYVAGVIDGHIVGTETNTGVLDVNAHVDLANLAAATASLHARSFDIAPLARLAPDVFLGVAGTLDANLDVTGFDVGVGVVEGRVQLTHAELPIAATIGTLRAGRVLIEAHQGDVKLTASGTIGDGSIEVDASSKLIGLVPNTGKADITLHDLVLLNAQQPRISGKVHADMTHDSSLWRIDAKFTGGDVNIPDASGTTMYATRIPDDIILVAGRKGNEDVVAAAALERSHAMLGNRPTSPYLIATMTLSPVSVLKKEFRGEISGKLTATIGKDGIALDGDIEADSGDVTLFDRRYQIDHTSLRFDGDIDPALDILLVHEFPDLSFNVAVRGRLSKPDLQLSADPSTYTQSQLLSFLLGGEPGTDEQPGNNAQAAAAGVGGSIAGGIFKSMVGGYLPVKLDVIRYDAGTDTASAAITIGKWLSRKLYIAGRQRPDSRPDENSYEGEVEYWVARRIVLELIAGDRNVDSADLLWTRRW